MAAPLSLLQRESWLCGFNSSTYDQEVALRFNSLQSNLDHHRILLAEADPVKFIAGFVAACVTGTPVILGNPKWAIAEWHQAIALTQPTLIWGECPIDPHLEYYDAIPQVALEPGWVLIATGGSSGQLRFVVHTWETLMASVAGFQQFFQVDAIHSLCVLPLHHVGGLMQVVRSLATQGSLALWPWKTLLADPLPPLNPTNLFLSLVPTQLQQLLKTPGRAEWLAQFRTVLLGGAPAWESLLNQARDATIRLAPTYGMTETASQIATQLPIDFLVNLDGYQILPHAEIALKEPASGAGALAIRATSLALGYVHTPEAPRFSALRSVFESDDVGVIDSLGRLHLMGRQSQMIISGGENVFPFEVETAIRATGLVADVCVLGLPDAVWGEAIAAAYVPISPTLTSSEIVAALSDRLSPYKCPKLWCAYPRLPRNLQGKINHLELTQQLVHYKHFDAPAEAPTDGWAIAENTSGKAS